MSTPKKTPRNPWLHAGLEQTIAAMLSALKDAELDAAHDALSDLLETPGSTADAIKHAAIRICVALVGHEHARIQAIAMAEAHSENERAKAGYIKIPLA